MDFFDILEAFGDGQFIAAGGQGAEEDSRRHREALRLRRERREAQTERSREFYRAWRQALDEASLELARPMRMTTEGKLQLAFDELGHRFEFEIAGEGRRARATSPGIKTLNAQVRFPALGFELLVESDAREASGWRLAPGRQAIVDDYMTSARKAALTEVTANLAMWKVREDRALVAYRPFHPTAETLRAVIDDLVVLAEVMTAEPGELNTLRGEALPHGVDVPPEEVAAAAIARGAQAPALQASAPTGEALAPPAPAESPKPATPSAAAAPQISAPAAAPFADLAAALFATRAASYQVKQAFEAEHAGRRAHWRGTLERTTPFSSDRVFDGEGRKATFAMGHIEVDGFERDLRCVVAFGPDADDADIDARAGEELAFTGTLVACDPFLRTVFLADGALADAR